MGQLLNRPRRKLLALNPIVLRLNGAHLSENHGTTILVRHSREGGNPSSLVLKGMDPRLRPPWMVEMLETQERFSVRGGDEA